MNGASNGTSNGTSVGGSNGYDDPAATFLSHILKQVESNNLVAGKQSRDDKVVEYVDPDQLADIIGLDIGTNSVKRNELEELCDKVVKYSVKTGHPNFYNQLFKGADEMGLAGSWLSDALNTNSYTFEVQTSCQFIS